MGAIFSAFAKPVVQITAAVVPIPGMGAVADVLAAVVILCDTVPQNKNAARHLAQRCQHLYRSLKQYEKKPLPNSTVQYRTDVFECLVQVRDMMRKWSEKSWFYMLVNQGLFEAQINGCNTRLSDCLTTFMLAAHMETLARQKEDEMWHRGLQESLYADRKAVMEEFAAPNFVQRVTENGPSDNQNDIRTISMMMQGGLAEHQIVSEEERKRMAKNLYSLLRLSKLLPPKCQLDSGEVEWLGEAPTMGNRNADVYKGRFLQSEDVRIKVIRSVNSKDERSIQRIRREVELWAKIHEIDQGKHIIPFYGFCTPDGLRLALVSPWMDNGSALAYVKKHDTEVDYRKLILGIASGIKVLHSMSIIHGNLRGENVVIGDEGQPLITDFALAKLEGNLITQTTGATDGCRWCAPEMWGEGGLVSTKGDVYSFGMTILELFTHEMPFSHIKKNPQVIFRKMEKDELPKRSVDERVIERGLDDEIWKILCRCWAKEPEDRPSIDDLVTQLEMVCYLR
ncbi:kinase-like domain-containing protein [Amanita rubescens]|nr:kinase-like domain-containing protein [Amanita rubescens]